MTQHILRVDASMRKTDSASRQLVSDLVAKLTQDAPSNIVERDLTDSLPFVNEAWIGANFTDASQRSPEQQAILAQSDALVEELKQMDTLVIGLPIYNFGVPAAFKAWIDLVARARLTFRYTENGPEGLLENKKAYVVVVSGGTQLDSDYDFISPWVRQVLGFMGIDDVTFIDASGLAMNQEQVLNQANAAIAAA